MPFVLFKAGDYGTKGKWSNEQLSNLINNKKELHVIPFHTSEFTKLGMLRNEIPVIVKFKNISVKDDEIIANDVEIFNRGEFKDRKVDRLSVEIENGEITRVGALPVGVEPAVSNSGSFANSEFSQGFEMDWINQKNIIEFRILLHKLKKKLFSNMKKKYTLNLSIIKKLPSSSCIRL